LKSVPSSGVPDLGIDTFEGFCRLVGAQAIIVGEVDLAAACAIKHGFLRFFIDITPAVAQLKP